MVNDGDDLSLRLDGVLEVVLRHEIDVALIGKSCRGVAPIHRGNGAPLTCKQLM